MHHSFLAPQVYRCSTSLMKMSNTTSQTGSNTYELSTNGTHCSFTAGIVSNTENQLDRHDSAESSSSQDLINYYNDIKTYIYTFVPPVFVAIGVFCNLLSLIVWVRGLLKKQGSSSSYFFACLAVADILALVSTSLYDHVANAYFIFQQDHSIYVDLRNYSNFLCKLYCFMFPFSLSLTSYILASLALFRMIGVIYPHRYKQTCCARNARKIILCIIASTLLLHFHIIFRAKLVNFPGVARPVCSSSVPTNKGFIRQFMILLMTILDFLVPMLIIVVCNIGIIWKLVKRKAQLDHTRQIIKGDHAFSRTVVVLVAVSLVYIITMSPMVVGIIFNSYINWRATSGLQLAGNKLFYALVFNICLLNSSTNFFTYCLAHPQFIPEVKLCFAVLAAKISSIFQKCRKRNTVGIIHIREVKVETANSSGIMNMRETVCTSGKTTTYGTASTSGLFPMVAIASTSGINPKSNTSDETDKISEDSL